MKMKKYLNTLFVTTQNSYLSKDDQSVVVKVEKKKRLRLPVHTLDGIVCFGTVSMSPFLMRHCAENDVAVSFFTEYGRFQARIHGPISGNVLLRREQYRLADKPESAGKLARSFIIGKLANSRTVLSRAIRDHSGKFSIEELQTVKLRLDKFLKRLESPLPIDVYRGIEGEAAANYFSIFNCLITAQKETFVFKGRNRRPPLDYVNAILSFLYTLLVHDCRSALEGVGLDPYVGYLHKDRPGRPSLALDLMEEFRSFLADRLTLSLINRQQLKQKNFRNSESGAVLLNDEGVKKVIIAWQKRKQSEIKHPYIHEKMPAGLIPHIQAKLLAKSIRGDIEGYPPFIWR